MIDMRWFGVAKSVGGQVSDAVADELSFLKGIFGEQRAGGGVLDFRSERRLHSAHGAVDEDGDAAQTLLGTLVNAGGIVGGDQSVPGSECLGMIRPVDERADGFAVLG